MAGIGPFDLERQHGRSVSRGAQPPLVRLLLVLLATAPCGCAPRERTDSRPAAIRATLDHFAGSPLSGAQPVDGVGALPGESLPVVVHFLSCSGAPRSSLASLGTAAKLIVVTDGARRVEAGPNLTRGARFGRLGEESAFFLEAETAAGCELLGTLRTALPRGLTAVFAVTDELVLSSHETRSAEKLELLVHRPAVESGTPGEPAQQPGFEIAVAVEARVEPDVTASPKDAADPTRELVLLGDVGARIPSAFVFVLRSPFRAAVPANVVVVLELHPPPPPGTDDRAELLARCLHDAREAAVGRPSGASSPTPAGRATDAQRAKDLRSALAGLESPASRRSALIFVAGATNARLAEALALAGEDALITRLAQSITGAYAESKPSAPQELGCLLEKEALRVAADAIARRDPPAGVEAIVAERVGEIHRYPGALHALASESTSLEDLDARALAENRSLLRDRAARTRARAHDWLLRRGAAVSGFDPLAPEPERRRVLAMEGASAEPDGAPAAAP